MEEQIKLQMGAASNTTWTMSSTLSLPGDDLPLSDVNTIEERIGNQIDLVVDGGPTGIEPTTVIDLSGGSIGILREGLGDISTLT